MRIKSVIKDMAILLVCSGLLVAGTHYYKTHPKIFKSWGKQATYADSSDEITVWYTNEKLTEYLTQATAEYTQKSNIPVELVCVESVDYMEQINQANMDDKAPDIYLMDSSMLEEAVMDGLAVENTDQKNYSKKNYYATAIKACKYEGKRYGYPLCFNTAFLVYNQEYVTTIPTSFDTIQELANQFEGDEKIKYMMEWDVKDLLYNYGFIGSGITYLDEPDENGSYVTLDETVLKAALEQYQNMSQYFSINLETVSYQNICDNFLNGKSIFVIAGTDILTDLKNSDISYGIVAYPNVSETIPSKSLATTELVMVNPYTDTEMSATDLAKYLTYDKAELISETSDYVSTRILSEDEDIKTVGEIYSSSMNLPNLMETSGYWLDLRLALNEAWSGTDLDTVYKMLQ